jgi:hypothetical protein
VDVWVYWSFKGREETSRVRDLSLGGLFVETAKSTTAGASVKLDFLVQEGRIGAEAVVRHVKSGGLGLKLSAMGNEDQKRLRANKPWRGARTDHWFCRSWPEFKAYPSSPGISLSGHTD